MEKSNRISRKTFADDCKITSDHPSAKTFQELNARFDAEIARSGALLKITRSQYTDSFLHDFKAPLKSLIPQTRTVEGKKNIVLALEKLKAEELDSKRWPSYSSGAVSGVLNQVRNYHTAAIQSEFCKKPDTAQTLACAAKQDALYTALGKIRGFLATNDKSDRGEEKFRNAQFVGFIFYSIEKKLGNALNETGNFKFFESLSKARETLKAEAEKTAVTRVISRKTFARS